MNALYCYCSSLFTTVGSVTSASTLVGRCLGFLGIMPRRYLCCDDMDTKFARTCVLLQSFIPRITEYLFSSSQFRR